MSFNSAKSNPVIQGLNAPYLPQLIALQLS